MDAHIRIKDIIFMLVLWQKYKEMLEYAREFNLY